MLKMISKFAASPFSGYLLIGILAALAAGGYWFWSELKQFGSLEAKSQSQEATIEQQRQQMQTLSAQIRKRQATLTEQTQRAAELSRNAAQLRQTIDEARNAAPKEYTDCRAVVVPERLRFGPSAADRTPNP